MKFKAFLFNRREMSLVERNFKPQYLRNNDKHQAYSENGYVVLENCISENDLEELEQIYLEAKTRFDFNIDNSFITTGNMRNTEIRTYFQKQLKGISEKILANIINSNNCSAVTGGSFLIKPPSSNSSLSIHQYIPIIDEQSQYASYLWIPLCNVNEENGTLKVLPKRHLWGNYQRSLSIPWIFGKFKQIIDEHMIPVSINRGDAICFDGATIHSSSRNKSKKERLAVSIAILPKEFHTIHYYLNDKSLVPKVEKYVVDEDFYTKENVLLKPSEKYKKLSEERWIGMDYITKSSIRKLIEK